MRSGNTPNISYVKVTSILIRDIVDPASDSFASPHLKCGTRLQSMDGRGNVTAGSV